MTDIPKDIALYRKFGLHASADELARTFKRAALGPQPPALTCRTCVHKDSDAKLDPCATCRDFTRWQGVEPVAFDETREQQANLRRLDAAAEKLGAPYGVQGMDEGKR